MKRKLEVCAVLCLTAGSLCGQDEWFGQDEWKQRMERGQAFERAGNYGQAAASYRDAVKIAEPFGPRDRRLLLALNWLALAYQEMGRFPDSERNLLRVLTTLEPGDGHSQADRALLIANLALAYREEGQIARAEDLYHQAIAIETEVLPADDAQLMLARAGLAELVLLSGRYQEAEPLIWDSLAAFEKRPERSRQAIGTLLGDLGVVRACEGRNKEAIELFRQAISMLEAELGPRHPLLLRPLINLAKASSSDAVFRRALSIAEENLGPGHPAYRDVLISYATFLRANGHKREAKALEQRWKQTAQGHTDGMTVDVSEFRPK